METHALLEAPRARSTPALPPGACQFKWNGKMCTGNELHQAIAIDAVVRSGKLGAAKSTVKEAVERATRILDQDPTQISARFRYSTRSPSGEDQEGSGEAIHIAVSRGSLGIVKLLVERGASLTSCVTRAGKDHYDVYHAAVFSEGRGGEPRMVDLLVESKAPPMVNNLDNKSPLHLAFQCGKISLIKAVRNNMHMWDEANGTDALKQVEMWAPALATASTPLEVGIQSGKLSENELSEVAPKSSVSLRIFMIQEPYCIPKFLDLVEAAEKGGAAKLAQEVAEGITAQDVKAQQALASVPDALEREHSRGHFQAHVSHRFQARSSRDSVIQREGRCDNLEKQQAKQGAEQLVLDLSEVLRLCPSAAIRLLDALAARPQCEHEGWHPLTKRMSFAPATRLMRLRNFLNPVHQIKPFYADDNVWRFDAQIFKGPPWHSEFLLDRKLNPIRPIRDVDIKVCHVKNLICAEFVAAIKSASDDNDDDMKNIYTNEIIRGTLMTVWWNGAVRVDLMQMFLSMWALCLLLIDSYLLACKADNDLFGGEGGAEARLLRGHGHSSGGASGGGLAFGVPAFGPGAHEGYKVQLTHSVPGAFIGARAMVDLVHELIQVIGYYKIGRSKDYLDVGNLYDIFRIVVPLIFFIQPDNRHMRIGVILIYWLRMYEINFSEYVANEVLPITRLVKGLVPATTVTFIGFLALTHAMYCLYPAPISEMHAVIRSSFTMLITGELPSGSMDDLLSASICYCSVLVFTVFFLNIFIGVIGNNYNEQREKMPEVFQSVRAGICLTFLLRAKIIPTWLCSQKCAGMLVVIMAAILAFIQVSCLVLEEGKDAGSLMRRIVLSHVPVFHFLNNYRSVFFFVCQSIMLLAAYQDPNTTWGMRWPGTVTKDHFLWVASVSERDFERDDKDDDDDVCDLQ